jgi:hypothetical protein
MAILHDAYRLGATQNVAFAAAGGANAQSAAFGSQTYWVLVSVVGIYAAGSGVRIAIGDSTGGGPVASATSTVIPVNFPFIFAVTPGQKIAVLSNDTTTGNLSVTELS